MDSNVSKNTNSHNFFKLEVEREKIGISVKNLLKQELRLILNLYQQRFSVQIEQKLITSILENKISISNQKNLLSEQKYDVDCVAQTQPVAIVYGCPIGLMLGSSLGQTAATTMQQIRQVVCRLENASQELPQSISVEVKIVDRGWINFYLSSTLLASWLQKMFDWHLISRKTKRQFTQTEVYDLNNNSASLFPAQYVHARCCSLLRLGARENIIDLSLDVDSASLEQQIKIKHKLLWLDEQHNLWLTESAEYNLLRQLLLVTDAWNEENSDRQWSKLVLNLSQVTAIFLAECRFLGEVKEQEPQRAIARLGLIALVRLWLEKMLVEKMGIAAPKSM